MGTIISSVEIFSMLFLLVIVCGLYRKELERNFKLRLFRSMVWATFLSLFFDAMSYTGPSVPWMQFTMNMLSYAMTPLISLIFGYYLIAVINGHKKVPYLFAHINTLINVIALVLIVTGSVNGKLFYIENGEYFSGPWTDIVCGLQVDCIVFLCILVIVYSGKLHKSEVLPLLLYFVPPAIAVVIEMIWPALGFSTASIAISIQIIYIMLVSGEIESAHVREKLLEDMAHVDLLTGLPNRRMFTEKLDSLPKDSLAGVVYCDVNSLKETNDKDGHAAGDALLCTFTDTLKRYFTPSEIYRISGDEFIVLTTSNSEHSFTEIVSGLISNVHALNDIASIGSAFGDGATIRTLIEESEKKMYENKREYYERAGNDRRGHVHR